MTGLAAIWDRVKFKRRNITKVGEKFYKIMKGKSMIPQYWTWTQLIFFSWNLYIKSQQIYKYNINGKC